MLVLSRTVGDGVLIDHGFFLTVTAIRPGESATLQYGPADSTASTHESRTLRRNETWELKPNVLITIVDLRPGPPDKVRLGIECPREMPVHRREVYEAIQREQHRPAE